MSRAEIKMEKELKTTSDIITVNEMEMNPQKLLLVAVALILTAYALLNQRQLAPKPKPTRRAWDEVDEASWESFPASDSPGW